MIENDSPYIDPKVFCLEKLKQLLKTIRQLTSQKILREDIDQGFAQLDGYGIKILCQLERH
jgi:hypothetical protein